MIAGVGIEATSTPVFADLFRSEFPAIVRDVELVTGDREAARDVAQEAFTRLYLHWRRVSRYDKPIAWVRRVAIREAVKQRERRRRGDELALLAARSPGPPPVRDPDLHRALLQLPPMQRAAIVLHYLHDLPARDVADTIGCREATARVHLHRGRRRLAELLGEEIDLDA